MDKLQLLKLLERYQNGECSQEETALIEFWYDKYSDSPDYLDSLSLSERELIHTRLASSIMVQVTPAEGQTEPAPKSISIFGKWWFKLSAAALVLIVMKVLFFNPKVSQNIVGHQTTQLHFINTSGNIVKKTFEDGSSVWLKPQASVYYPRHFARSSRQVSMQGECFFEISKNPDRPFIIVSSHLLTKVWGTSFEVSDFVNAERATVKVVTGKVSVSKRDDRGEVSPSKLSPKEIILLPKQQVIYDPSGQKLLAGKDDQMKELAIWHRIDLSFDHASLSQIISELNGRFAVTIRTESAQLGEKQMTADLSGLNLAEVLDVLKASMKIDYEINGETITLKQTNNK
jgi:ferric-dicitrate binding protein FerR (iron transport regulator)